MAWAQKRLQKHIGKSKGGNNTKIHAAVDEKCRPLKLLLSAGNVNDIKVAPRLLDGLSLDSVIVMADKAYCSRNKKRNIVERFFRRLKENHRLAMRFDKRPEHFMAFILFASILLWLK